MIDIEKIDLNKILEEIHKKIFETSENPQTPITKYEVETFKKYKNMFYTVKMEVIPGNLETPPYSWWHRFIHELELLKSGYCTVDELIDKYKKRLVLI